MPEGATNFTDCADEVLRANALDSTLDLPLQSIREIREIRGHSDLVAALPLWEIRGHSDFGFYCASG